MTGLPSRPDRRWAPPVAALPTPQQTSAAASYKFDPHTGQPIQPPIPPAAKFDPYTGKPLTAGSLPTVVDAEVVDRAHAPA